MLFIRRKGFEHAINSEMLFGVGQAAMFETVGYSKNLLTRWWHYRAERLLRWDAHPCPPTCLPRPEQLDALPHPSLGARSN